MKTMSRKLVSLLLVMILFSTSALNCYAETEILSQKSEEEVQTVEKWQEYFGDIEAFAYGLIISQLGYSYDVFPAYVDLSDGNSVYGIAYTDYKNCYASDDETTYCFEAGFVPFNGELPVPNEDFDSGLYIRDLEYTDDHASFLWVYSSDEIKEHCVVYNKYLQYGIDNNGAICYDATDYIPGTCDESLGSLYSYDESKYLLDFDVGTYLRITGASLFSQLDFDELEKEINEILRTQDINFATVDVVSCANFAQEAIVSYLLSLQEETFLGYSVSELVAAANALDPLECYRLTENGLITLQLQEGVKATELTKWLVGTSCAILTAVALVGSVVFIECPPLSALAGSVAGTAIEIFMQVVVSEKDPQSVDWRKVALGAAAGAVSGFLGPYLAASYGGAAYFLVDSAMDGLIGGIERAAEAWMDNKDAQSIINSFGTGFAMGFVISAGFKGIGTGLSKIAKKIGPGIKKITEKLLPAKAIQKASAIKDSIGEALGSLKKRADSSIFHSEYISNKTAEKQISRLLKKNQDELIDNSIKHLSVDDIYDMDGNKITKEALSDMAKKADNGTAIGYFKKGDDVVSIVKENNVVSIAFDQSQYQSVTISGGLSANRSENFIKAAQILKDQWLDNYEKIPASIAKLIQDSGKELADTMPSVLVGYIQRSDMVMHECIDRITVSLVPRALHETIRHSGGVSLAKFIKSNIVSKYFDRFISAAATEAVIAVH